MAYIDTVVRQTEDVKKFKQKFHEINSLFNEQNAALRDLNTLFEAHFLVRSIVMSCGLPYRSRLVVPDFNISVNGASELHHKMWQTIEYDLLHYPKLGKDRNISLATINQTHQARKVHHEKLGQQIDAFIDISNRIIASRWKWVSGIYFKKSEMKW